MDHPCSLCNTQPATLFCLCQSSPLFFCRAHIADHLDSPGDHLPRKVVAQIQAQTGFVCSVCQMQQATELCCCKYPVAIICAEHKNVHLIKEASGLHEFFPISLHSSFSSSDIVSTIRSRLISLQRVRELFTENFTTIAHCEEAVQVRYDSLLLKLTQVRDSHLKDLRTLREALMKVFEEALQSFKTHLVDRGYSPGEGVEALVHGFTPREDPAILTLVKFEEQDIDPRFDLLFGLTWESRFNPASLMVEPTWLKVTPPRLAVIHPKDFCIYDCGKGTWSKVDLDKEIITGQYSAQAFLPDGCLFTCGGYVGNVSRAEAYRISLKTGAVTSLKPMLVPRRCHPIYPFKSNVYVFGGYTTAALKQCDKFSLERNEWTQMENMHSPRYNFTVCPYKGLLYLMGGCTTQGEVFDPILEEFRPLSLAIPESAATVAVVWGDTIVIVTPARMMTVDADSLAVKATVTRSGPPAYLLAMPVLFHNEFYYADLDQINGLCRLNPVTGEFKKDLAIVFR